MFIYPLLVSGLLTSLYTDVQAHHGHEMQNRTAPDSYLVYVRTYGRLASLGKLTNDDYRAEDGTDLPADLAVALSIAAEHVSMGERLSAREDFKAELERLLGQEA